MSSGKIFTLLTAALAAAGCHAGLETRPPVYAIWVTRQDYRTAGDVKRIVHDCAQGGFNTVLFQVRGNGTAFYRSTFEPWADELGGKHPGYDPLELACREAHRRGLALHAWVNVMPAWQGPDPPKNPSQLYNRHPEWFWYDRHGRRQPLVHRVGKHERAWYVSLNPCLPEVRGYLVAVCREIVRRYDVDGLHLDYIRFPDEPVVPGEAIPDYPRDERTLALFKQATGSTPDGSPAAWDRWRTEQVTRLVANLHVMMRETRPRAALTATVGTNRQRSLEHHREGKAWVEQALVDAVFPMNYTSTLAAFDRGLAMWLPPPERVGLVPGLWLDAKLSTADGITVARRQIRRAVEKTGNFCLFAYDRLFDSPGHAKETPDRERENARAREHRRRSLLPLIRSLPRRR